MSYVIVLFVGTLITWLMSGVIADIQAIHATQMQVFVIIMIINMFLNKLKG